MNKINLKAWDWEKIHSFFGIHSFLGVIFYSEQHGHKIVFKFELFGFFRNKVWDPPVSAGLIHENAGRLIFSKVWRFIAGLQKLSDLDCDDV